MSIGLHVPFLLHRSEPRYASQVASKLHGFPRNFKDYIWTESLAYASVNVDQKENELGWIHWHRLGLCLRKLGEQIIGSFYVYLVDKHSLSQLGSAFKRAYELWGYPGGRGALHTRWHEVKRRSTRWLKDYDGVRPRTLNFSIHPQIRTECRRLFLFDPIQELHQVHTKEATVLIDSTDVTVEKFAEVHPRVPIQN